MKNTPVGQAEDLEFSVENGRARVRLHGTVSVYAPQSGKALVARLAGSWPEIKRLEVDLADVKHYDSYLSVLVGKLRDSADEHDVELDFQGVSPTMRRFLDLLQRPAEEPPQARVSAFRRRVESIGQSARASFADWRAFVAFFGEITIKGLGLLRRPGDFRWKDLPFLFARAGVAAVPIVTLIGFLVGMIIGYQGALQLKQFGADVYLANLTGISITRELGPLMTAIIVAGRSGASYAAEIGTMKVSDELDALHSLGFDVTPYLVLPRIVAVVLVIPVLTLMADFAGIIGGLLAGEFTLELSSTVYLTQLKKALTFAHVFTGLFKSVVFGFLIAAVGCFKGMQVYGGAESVGKFTTSAVVTAIFLIILSDAVFAFIFEALNI